MMRPFEVGDLVIGTTIYRPEIYREFVIKIYSDGFKLDEGGYCFDLDEVSIKKIRTPRKGSKESRDIVAMLAKQYRETIKRDDHQFYKWQAKEAYITARGMLK